MKIYNRMLIFENTAKRKLLIKFRELLVSFFNDQKWDDFSRSYIESEEGAKKRVQINKLVNRVSWVINEAGVSASIYYSPPPISGGFAGHIDLLQNLFNLESYRISPQQIIDIIDRAIGNYEGDRFNAALRVINPLFWFGLLLDYIVSLPFKLIGKMGFSEQKAEGSVLGRIIKGVLYLIMVFASLLSIFYYLDYLDWFKQLVGSFIKSSFS